VVRILHDICIHYFNQNIDENDTNLCVKCITMKNDIKVILDELKSTQEIVRIMHDEIQKKPGEVGKQVNLTNCTKKELESKHYTSNENTSEWRQVLHKKPSNNQTQKAVNKFKHHTTHSQTQIDCNP
jgi:hypothetical protein